MDPALEIRKLPSSVLKELSQILEYGNQWKDLMGIIPKQLIEDYSEAFISEGNPPKYNSEHIQIIDQSVPWLKKSPTAILVDEWGTSGRPRPTLGHLLFFLKQAKLYRAADCVSVELLKQSPVSRPKYGPESAVKLHYLDWLNNIPHFSSLLKMDGIIKIKDLESLLDDIKYPFSESETDGPRHMASNSTTNLINFSDGIEDERKDNLEGAETLHNSGKNNIWESDIITAPHIVAPEPACSMSIFFLIEVLVPV